MNNFRIVRFYPELSLGPSYVIGAMVWNDSQFQFIENDSVSKQVPEADLELAIALQRTVGRHPGDTPHRATNCMVRFDNPISVPGDAVEWVRLALFKGSTP